MKRPHTTYMVTVKISFSGEMANRKSLRDTKIAQSSSLEILRWNEAIVGNENEVQEEEKRECSIVARSICYWIEDVFYRGLLNCVKRKGK